MMNRRQFVILMASLAPAGFASAGFMVGRTDRISGTREKALRFLLERQAKDGSWRSRVYGGFQSGAALTPLVALAIAPFHRKEAERAVDWLLEHHEEAMAAYPVHNASYMLQLARWHDRLGPLVKPLVKRLRDLQLGSRLGWKKEHRSFGGWGYFGLVTPWQDGIMLAPMQESNLSPTLFAMAGLRAAGVVPKDPAMVDAAAFVRSCQNFQENGAKSKFDDGGFHQMLGDPHRNKAGVSGTDANGVERYHSYTAATADGLHGMLLSGTPIEHPRVKAAITWLREHPAPNDVPHLEFYSAWARREAAHVLDGPLTPAARPAWPFTIPQNADGSWKNPAGEYREDDPLVATAMAAMALTLSKEIVPAGS